jgi:chromatin remodeling complex protein RSC6
MSIAKRTFDDIDESLPEFLWDRLPEHSKKLKRIIELEENVDQLLMSSLRSAHAMNSERNIKTKIMRIYFHHKYVPQSGEDRSHFLLTVEGQLLDNDYKYFVPFASCFEKIRFVPESGKRQQTFEKQTEWAENVFPDGLKASCFRAKVYGDKAMNLRVFLHRRSNVVSRYEISPRLRVLIPYIRVDPTEDEVMQAVWQYLIANNLFVEGKEKKVVRCDEVLRDIIGSDTILLSSLKVKVFEELLPSKPIQIDYSLTMSDTTFGDR